MRGFPPSKEARVTHAQQLLGPYNRWSFQNIQKLNPTAEVWRGEGAVVHFDREPRDLDGISYQRRNGSRYTFGEMLELSYTDGIAVIHQGKMIYERYLNSMQAHTLHAWASGSKSMTGTLAAMLAHEGLFDLENQITYYLPELKESGFAGATVQQAMDMTTTVKFRRVEGGPLTAHPSMVEDWQYSVTLGWLAKPEKYTGPETSYELLATMYRDGEHGERFTYQTPNSDILAWIIKRLLNKPLADIMQERIWSKMGVERDAAWVVGPTTEETSGSGLITTLRDMARFGQMMLQKGRFNGKQIVPEAVIEDMERVALPGSHNPMPYHNQWWLANNEHGAYYALGYGGQILYIDPSAQLVVAKMSSYPVPVDGGEEFFHAFAALPALANELVK
ncbi:6-aminohexanoate-dimer hydrolase [Ktedonospora formicarum]|uniref:6-aminohexanoate-dimer hydrolase n=2 Tax=Ktedonospora formicarum TaxID=2778364 RepID=A0A8J3I6L7_9CHLR|nr:6-aminohexanoate-dimer hydrolase [Ktedonospora formicarum]